MKHIHSITAVAASLLVNGILGATSGKLSVLSMNVAGLPAFLNPNDVPGDKSTNAKTIGTRFTQLNYDVIHVQEVNNPADWHPLTMQTTRAHMS